MSIHRFDEERFLNFCVAPTIAILAASDST